MKGKIYNIASLIIGVGTLVYMLYNIGLPAIWENILVTGVWFIPVIGSWLIIYILNALAFREIIYEKSQPITAIPFLYLATLLPFALSRFNSSQRIS
jgi:hypothetical protein